MTQPSEEQIWQDPIVQRIMQQLPADSRASFTAAQLLAMKTAFGARRWFRHPLDLRGSLKIWRWHFYYVILAGRERRQLSPEELSLARLANFLVALFLVALFLISGLLTLYLMKSALGINLLPDFSLGIWDWFSGP